jgi:predicted nucleic acid-binding protein
MLILDTSAILNLLGTARPKFLLENLSDRVLAPPAVIDEVLHEPTLDIEKDASFSDLLSNVLIETAQITREIESLAILLAGAPTPDNLDDGEAFAIACAVINQAGIVLDERKARRIVHRRRPALICLYTLDLIETAARQADLDQERCAEIIFNALRSARMRIPSDRRREVVQLIGRERASQCPSLGSF